MKKLFENFRQFHEENNLNKSIQQRLMNRPYDIQNGKAYIQPEVLEKIFKYFHLSFKLLDKEKFTFNPRTPISPWSDGKHNTEDDFTKRISLASSIEDSLEALEASVKAKMHVYAVDTIKMPDDDIDVVHTRLKIKKCPKSQDNAYGPKFQLAKWLRAKTEIDPKSIYGPADLPSKLRNQFFGCVPDAEITDEKWSLEDVSMYYIGLLSVPDYIIVLSPAGKKIIDKYINFLKKS